MCKVQAAAIFTAGTRERAAHISVHYHLHWESMLGIMTFILSFIILRKLELCMFSSISDLEKQSQEDDFCRQYTLKVIQMLII